MCLIVMRCQLVYVDEAFSDEPTMVKLFLILLGTPWNPFKDPHFEKNCSGCFLLITRHTVLAVLCVTPVSQAWLSVVSPAANSTSVRVGLPDMPFLR